MIESQLKIGLISYRSNPHCGGQGVYIRHLSHALADLGHDVEIIAGPPDPQVNGRVNLTMLDTLNLYDPEDLFRTPRPHELKDPISMLEWLGVSSQGYPEPMTFGLRARRYVKTFKKTYDIIHDNQCLAYSMLSFLKQMPVTATIHHPMTVDRRLAIKDAPNFYQKVKAVRWYSFIGMQKYVARRIPDLITVSDSSKFDIAREFKIPADRLRTIPIGIDINHFYPIDSIKKDPNRIIVTNSADMALKGLHFLLRAIRNIADKRPVKLVVIGTPKKKGTIEKLVKKLDIAQYIKFTGRIEYDEFVREYARAGMAVVPSLYEGFGLPVGEAMACRTPVISTTGGALPEVAGDAAKMVPPGDALALENAITELMDDAKQREELAEKGYKRVMEHFTWENCARKTAQAYREIIHAYH